MLVLFSEPQVSQPKVGTPLLRYLQVQCQLEMPIGIRSRRQKSKAWKRRSTPWIGAVVQVVCREVVVFVSGRHRIADGTVPINHRRQRRERDASESKRIRSWCAEILWCSCPGGIGLPTARFPSVIGSNDQATLPLNEVTPLLSKFWSQIWSAGFMMQVHHRQ